MEYNINLTNKVDVNSRFGSTITMTVTCESTEDLFNLWWDLGNTYKMSINGIELAGNYTRGWFESKFN